MKAFPELEWVILDRARDGFDPKTLGWELAKQWCDSIGEAGRLDAAMRRTMLDLWDRGLIEVRPDCRVKLRTASPQLLPA